MAGRNFKKVHRKQNGSNNTNNAIVEDRKSDIHESGNIRRVTDTAKPAVTAQDVTKTEKTEQKEQKRKKPPRVPGSPEPIATPLTHGISGVVGGDRETVYGDRGITRGRGMLTVSSLAEKRERDARRDSLNLKPQDDNIFALDIGTRTVVGVFGHSEMTESGERFILRECVSAPHMKRAMIDGQIEDIRQVAKVVEKIKADMEEKTGHSLQRVSIAAAGRALSTRHTTMEFDVSGTEITFEMIKSMEIETILKAQRDLDAQFQSVGQSFHCVGHSVVAWRLDDHKILSLEGHKGDTASVELIATFLPNLVVEGLYTVMEMNELEVSSLTLEPIAAMNAIVPVEIRLINIALIDIGAGTSDIAIVRDGSIIAYNMATTAGDEITEELIKTYLVDFDTAEKIKIACCSGENCTYNDIFGVEQSTTPEEFSANIKNAVSSLSETICNSIIEANGSSPVAVFLIGGGSLVAGLKEEVAKRLGLPESKVSIGSERNLRTVDTGGRKMGAEYITPLGIALTCILNKGYDFSVIALNDKKVRIFDTKKLSVFELLSMNGYRPEEIMGRSGRNLSYYLNGQNIIVKGGNIEPAVVRVNGEDASLATNVSNGDTVEFIPAISGKNGSAKVSDIVDFDKYNSGFVKFGGEKHEIGVEVLVNGKEARGDYSIQPLDKLEVYGILTIDDLMQYLGVEIEDTLWKVDGRFADGSYVLKNGESIEYADEQPAGYSSPAAEQPTAETFVVPGKADYVDSLGTAAAVTAESASASDISPVTAVETESLIHGELVRVPYVRTLEELENDTSLDLKTAPKSEKNIETETAVKTITLSDGTEAVLGGGSGNNAGFDSYPENSWGEITINFNGAPLTLPANDRKSPHLFLELLNHADMDLDDPKGAYTMQLNGIAANFNDALTDGDTAVLGWDEHVSRIPGIEINPDDPLKKIANRNMAAVNENENENEEEESETGAEDDISGEEEAV